MIVIRRHTECERGVSQDKRSSSSSSLILCSPISVDPSPSLYISESDTQQPKHTTQNERKTEEKRNQTHNVIIEM